MQVIIVDAKNAMFRFGFIGRGLTSSSGQRTGAMHGVLMGMLALIGW